MPFIVLRNSNLAINSTATPNSADLSHLLPQNVLPAFTFVVILEVRNENVNVLMNIPVSRLGVKTHVYQIT